MKMDAQYFIDKFEAIPEERWCTSVFRNGKGQMCANGHCGVKFAELSAMRIIETEESSALCDVFTKVKIHDGFGNPLLDYSILGRNYSNIAALINNGRSVEYQQFTPKQRILAALRDVQTKEQQDKAVEEVKEVLAQETELV